MQNIYKKVKVDHPGAISRQWKHNHIHCIVPGGCIYFYYKKKERKKRKKDSYVPGEIPRRAENTAACQSQVYFFFLQWHLQRGCIGRMPNKQQISGVLMPGSGTDSPSLWRLAPSQDPVSICPYSVKGAQCQMLWLIVYSIIQNNTRPICVSCLSDSQIALT